MTESAARPTGVATTACYSVADVRTRRAVTADTPFSLGSLTKPVVASVLVQLASPTPA